MNGSATYFSRNFPLQKLWPQCGCVQRYPERDEFVIAAAARRNLDGRVWRAVAAVSESPRS